MIVNFSVELDEIYKEDFNDIISYIHADILKYPAVKSCLVDRDDGGTCE